MKSADQTTDLRPRIINPSLWFPDRPPKREWDKLREQVLERDNYTCCFCGHQAQKWMNIHHLTSSSNKLSNLRTVCVACHAVLHVGYNLGLGILEIWKSEITQIEIVRRTRGAIAKGRSLAQINKTFRLTEGHYPPNSIQYANDLVEQIGNKPVAYLKEPLCAVFVKLQRWQIEG
jgi:hypothetical protein